MYSLFYAKIGPYYEWIIILENKWRQTVRYKYKYLRSVTQQNLKKKPMKSYQLEKKYCSVLFYMHTLQSDRIVS